MMMMPVEAVNANERHKNLLRRANAMQRSVTVCVIMSRLVDLLASYQEGVNLAVGSSDVNFAVAGTTDGHELKQKALQTLTSYAQHDEMQQYSS